MTNLNCISMSLILIVLIVLTREEGSGGVSRDVTYNVLTRNKAIKSLELFCVNTFIFYQEALLRNSIVGFPG